MPGELGKYPPGLWCGDSGEGVDPHAYCRAGNKTICCCFDALPLRLGLRRGKWCFTFFMSKTRFAPHGMDQMDGV
ncbi:MAG: hypothetical protein CVU41_05500 [Chloroflexi bacterium HGW-Chloroflexi-3]|nr:MAG: hypothetical protein CVU41_05500 [Chloroflexi bacterium HGW-Chloroflexi-3]